MTSAAWTEAFHTHTWLGPAVWALLHSLDYFLTMWAAALYRSTGHRFFDFDGSIELNPLFESTVEKGRWFSGRFVVTLVGAAGLLWLIAALATYPFRLFDGLLGAIVFTRVAVIATHITNIRLFVRAARDPEAIVGHIRYTRPTVHILAGHRYLSFALIVGVAALIAPNAFLTGGTAGLLLLGLGSLRQARKAAAGGKAVPPPDAEPKRRKRGCITRIMLGLAAAALFIVAACVVLVMRSSVTATPLGPDHPAVAVLLRAAEDGTLLNTSTYARPGQDPDSPSLAGVTDVLTWAGELLHTTEGTRFREGFEGQARGLPLGAKVKVTLIRDPPGSPSSLAFDPWLGRQAYVVLEVPGYAGATWLLHFMVDEEEGRWQPWAIWISPLRLGGLGFEESVGAAEQELAEGNRVAATALLAMAAQLAEGPPYLSSALTTQLSSIRKRLFGALDWRPGEVLVTLTTDRGRFEVRDFCVLPAWQGPLLGVRVSKVGDPVTAIESSDKDAVGRAVMDAYPHLHDYFHGVGAAGPDPSDDWEGLVWEELSAVPAPAPGSAG